MKALMNVLKQKTKKKLKVRLGRRRMPRPYMQSRILAEMILINLSRTKPRPNNHGILCQKKWRRQVNHQMKKAAAARVSLHDGTALHYAIRKKCRVDIIQQLVELMDNGVLEITDFFGSTALYDLIRLIPERVEVAECMVTKNPNLLTILPNGVEKALVAIAQANNKGEKMARYLYFRTPPETIKVTDAAQLISDGFRLQRFGISIKPLPPLNKEKHESE